LIRDSLLCKHTQSDMSDKKTDASGPKETTPLSGDKSKKKKSGGGGMGNAVFGIGCVFLIAICGPFLYYSYLSYEWGMSHKP